MRRNRAGDTYHKVVSCLEICYKSEKYFSETGFELWSSISNNQSHDHCSTWTLVEDVGNFSWSLTPTPFRRQFFTTICRQIWPIFDPSPLRNADVLNGWSLRVTKVVMIHNNLLTQSSHTQIFRTNIFLILITNLNYFSLQKFKNFDFKHQFSIG